MWLVRTAMKRPYSVFVLAAVIFILGTLAFFRMRLDIFPVIDIPVVNVVWNYPGLSALDMEERMVLIAERAYSTTVNGISRIESESINGTGLIKVYFHQGQSIAGAIAQINSVSETLLRIFPPGTVPPNIVQYNASNVPIAELEIGSRSVSEQKLYDLGLNFIRVRLFTIPGLSTPAPFGGKFRQVMVDINPDLLYGYGLSPDDIVSTLTNSNIIVPAGTAKIGDQEVDVQINGSPSTLAGLGRLPVKSVNGRIVRLQDVARVHDGYAVQENIVRVNGHRSTYLALYKHADASTLTVISRVRALIPRIASFLPANVHLKLVFDQSVFVRNALEDVLKEALIGTVLVSLMVFLFLRDLRSSVIVFLSIPLSILTALFFLKLCGQSLNIMTLGGLALAIGMLVDDATVAIENIERNRLLAGDPLKAVWDGANQVAVPAFVGTAAIVIVFFPVLLLRGVSQFLYTPLAFSVVFAMMASYILSRTMVVTLSMMFHKGGDPADPAGERSFFLRGFEALRSRYETFLGRAVRNPRLTLGASALVIVLLLALLSRVGLDFFPTTDAGLLALHMRAPVGSRIEVTDRDAREVEGTIRSIIPKSELDSVDVNIGLPVYFNLAFYQTDSIGPGDADFLISLKNPHHSIFRYRREIRQALLARYPEMTFWFKPADIISQVLDFGLSAPIDIQVEGRDLERSDRIARRIRAIVKTVPGAVDVTIPQVLHYPAIFIKTDRDNALAVGVTQNDIATNLLVTLASSSLVAPNYWVNPKNTVNYIVAVQTPTREIASMAAIDHIPIRPSQSSLAALMAAMTTPLPAPTTQYLSNIAHVRIGTTPGSITHYTVQRVVDVLVNTEGRSLGAVYGGIRSALKSFSVPPGTILRFRGQSAEMFDSFRHFGLGLLLAALLVYLLLVMNFQSFLDPFIILMSVPAGLSGVALALFATHTTLNVESAMGAIMVVGVATANSILVVTFANDLRGEGLSSEEAAIRAGATRLRPVLMTATAMILGMLPMALGMGSGGEQNAPLGRAVIGGLLMGTVSTLLLVPTLYRIMRKTRPNRFRYDDTFRKAIGHD